MFPTIFSIGSLSISSFGFFLSLAFLFGTFLIWRLAKAWTINEEKVLDIILLTFFGGLIISRVYFIAQNSPLFGWDIMKMILVAKYPGFSFWGSFLGGWLSLYIFSRKLKMDFWQIADLISVGFVGGLVLGNIGCFLGGCGYGVESNLFFATKVAGVIGYHFPVQLLESLLFLVALYHLWLKSAHFHEYGKIVSIAFMWIGSIKFITEFFRANAQQGHYFAITIFLLGLTVYYRVTKRSFKEDLKSAFMLSIKFFTDTQTRKMVLEKGPIVWYNALRDIYDRLTRKHIRDY